MGRPRTGSHAVPTRERILDAAERAFGADGFGDTKLADIASSAEIRRSSLLYHFPSKVELHAAVVVRVFDALQAAFAQVVAEPRPHDAQVVALVQAYLAFLERRPAFAGLVLRGLMDGRGPARELLQVRLVPLLQFIEAYVGPHAPPGVPVRAALLQIGSDALVRATAGPLRDTLWGPSQSLALAKTLLIRQVDPPEANP
jgi:AcrR family transcriptional regulator